MAQQRKREIIAAGLESIGMRNLQVPTSAKYLAFGPRTSVGFVFVTKNGSVRVGKVWSDSKPSQGLEFHAYNKGLALLGRKEKKSSTSVEELLGLVL